MSTPQEPDDSSRRKQSDVLTSWILGLCGAGVGAAFGSLVFVWLMRYGFYGLAAPGWLMGIACGFASRRGSWLLGVVCAALAVPVALLLEWKYRPFIADPSLSYFLRNLHDLTPVTWLMLGLGTFLAFWFGRGRG